MANKVKSTISNYKIIIIIFVLFALAASFQALLSGTRTYQKDGIEYNKYNNYTIFEKSFEHLKEGKDLYMLFPEEHWDLFKYSPTFAVFFGIFAVTPDWLGLNLWNLLNALLLVGSVYYLPKLNNYQKGLILILLSIELMTSLQNAQSNGLIAGLLVLAFALLEREKYSFATLLIVFSVFVKLFGIVGFVLFLFYPKKWKLVLYSILWSVLLFAIPLIFIDYSQYKLLISSFGNLLFSDHTVSHGLSVMGLLSSWFGVELNKMYIVLAGMIVFLIPFVKIKEYKNYTFRLLALSSLLIWVVIFNHKAESPTYVIAITGAAIWFVISEKNKLNIALFALAFLLTSLSPTDIFPRFIRNEYIKPFTLKALPCIFIWFKIIYDMIVFKDPEIPKEVIDVKKNSAIMSLKSNYLFFFR
ncbi:MAG: DUF2029 domain-containing protein [Bacteroidetes bacterium]|nr:DUF2029 domain-containing protein [Bacteroidota bacterium]MBU1116165.1 DUF2029 domain-containing protein [Bacteroidota bacterium]MBU1800457.1 DUF2029 domain-containing protein [Bacteroidota bacterium]